MVADVKEPDAVRFRLVQELEQLEIFRPGSLNKTFRRCGKPSCGCAESDHPGHPQFLLTKSVNGKTVARTIHESEVELVSRQIASYHKFRELIRQITEVNEQLADAELAEQSADAQAPAKKGAPRRSSSRKPPRRSPPS